MSRNLSESIAYYQDQRNECLTITLYANILWKDRNVLCLYYGHSLIDEKVDFLLNLYKDSCDNGKFNARWTLLEILKDLIQLPDLPNVVDIGQLKDTLIESQSITKESLIAKLWYIQLNNTNKPTDVVLYGFGRIGRLLARELCADPALQVSLNLKAVVTRDLVDIDFLQRRASLLKKDSIHGSFKGIIEIDEQSNSLIVNGKQVRFISSQKPSEIDYSTLGIEGALLIDNTGKYRNKKGLTQHLECNGVSNVIVTAPGIDIQNIVLGVNHTNALNSDFPIFSAASCTTNAISPVLNIVQSTYGIVKGHIETIHAYTNDQNLVDNMHGKARRGRAAALNMVITETGAGEAVSKIIPQLKDKFTSNAIRVPIANGSLAILVLELNNKTSVEQIHQLLMQDRSSPTKNKQLKVSFDEDLVSSDIIGNAITGIVDGCATSVSKDGYTLTLYVWYDNEYGYSMQVLGLASWLSNHICENSERIDHSNVENANLATFI